MARRDNYLAFFLVFFGITLVIILLGRIGILNLIIDGTSTVSWKVSSLFNIGKSQKEEALISPELRKKVVENTNLLIENKALRDQFSTSHIPTQNLIAAKIVGSPGFIPAVSAPDYLVIDKGRSSGLEEGQAVIYKDNLVGKIASLGNNYSKVELIIKAPTFTAKVVDNNKEIIGVVKARGNSLVLDNVQLFENLKKDQLVLTKGDLDEGGIGIPADLVVGKIISIEKKASSLFQKAEIKSFVDFNNLTQVFVIK